MLSVPEQVPVYLYTAAADMRHGIDRLSEKIRSELGRTPISGGVFVLCARQGAHAQGCKSPADPVRGTASRTARVSIVRWNLKEAAGKTLA